MIKLKVVKSTECTVSFQISRQDKRNIKFKASNGWNLKCFNYPELETALKILYLRGNNTMYDDITITCTKTTFEKIKCAVNEYNCSLAKEMVKTKKDETPKKELYIVEVDSDIDIENFDSYERAKKYAIEEIKDGAAEAFIYKRIAEITPIKKIDFVIKEL